MLLNQLNSDSTFSGCSQHHHQTSNLKPTYYKINSISSTFLLSLSRCQSKVSARCSKTAALTASVCVREKTLQGISSLALSVNCFDSNQICLHLLFLSFVVVCLNKRSVWAGIMHNVFSMCILMSAIQTSYNLLHL